MAWWSGFESWNYRGLRGLGDLDRLVQTTVENEGHRVVLRNQAPGCAGAVFQAVRVALPPNDHLVTRLGELLPWNWTRALPEAGRAA